MANAEYQPGDKVKVLSYGHQMPVLDATIVRAMTDADDYEVEYDEEQPGASPIVHPDRLVLVANGVAPVAEPSIESVEPAEATPAPAESDTEASLEDSNA